MNIIKVLWFCCFAMHVFKPTTLSVVAEQTLDFSQSFPVFQHFKIINRPSFGFSYSRPNLLRPVSNVVLLPCLDGSTVARLQHDTSTTWFQTSNLVQSNRSAVAENKTQ